MQMGGKAFLWCPQYEISLMIVDVWESIVNNKFRIEDENANYHFIIKGQAISTTSFEANVYFKVKEDRPKPDTLYSKIFIVNL